MSDYHGDTTHLSKSALNVFIESSMDYYMQYISGEMERKRATQRMVIGTIIHAILLENKKLDEIAVVYDASCFQKNGNLNGAAASKFRELHSDKFALRDYEYAAVNRVLVAVSQSELAAIVNEGTAFEHEYRAIVCGVKCKCKPDILADLGSRIVITDLKCMERIHPDAFRLSSRRFRYWLQDTHYSAVVSCALRKPVWFRFVAIETQAPYRIHTYWFDEASRENAREFHRLKLGTFQACQQSGDWSDRWDSQLSVAPWEIGYSGEGELVEVSDEI